MTLLAIGRWVIAWSETSYVSEAWLEENHRREGRRGLLYLPPWNWPYLIDQMRRRRGAPTLRPFGAIRDTSNRESKGRSA